MAKKKMGGLGKGLDSLFADLSDDTGSEASGSTLLLREIEPDPEQPRKRFDDDALNQLADSIVENGLLQPIAVRPKKVGPGYIIIAGERRWRAARLAGLVEVPVIIKDVTDEQAAALALIENLQREDLDPIEVAEGCRQLIDKYGLTQESAAKKLGKSRSAVANSLRLLALPEDVRRLVSEGKLSFGHAKVLLGLPGDTYACRQPDPVLQQVEHTNSLATTTNDAFKAVCRYWDRVVRPEQLMSAMINAFRVLTDPANTGAVCVAMPQDLSLIHI